MRKAPLVISAIMAFQAAPAVAQDAARQAGPGTISAPVQFNGSGYRARGVLVDAELLIEFQPSEAFVLYEDGNQLKQLPATLVPPIITSLEATAVENAKWLVGALVPRSSESKEFLYGFVVFGKGGEAASTSAKVRRVGTEIDSYESVDTLKADITRKKEILDRDLNLQQMQEGELKRLQSDVDLIADIGRIVEVREDFMSTEEHVKRLDKDIASFSAALNQIGACRIPKSFMRREAELSRQLIDITLAAKHAEDAARRQQKSTELTPEQKQEVVDSVQDANEQALVQHLGALKRYRAQLEEQSGITSGKDE